MQQLGLSYKKDRSRISDEKMNFLMKALFYQNAPTFDWQTKGGIWMANHRDFVGRKIHSLLGVIPIGLFLLSHFTTNYFIVRGEEDFNKAAEVVGSVPYRLFLEVFVIFIPIILHGIYGVYIAFTGSANTGRYTYFRNWMYVLQRFSGIFLVVFITWHVWETRIAAAMGTEVDASMMQNIVDNGFMLAFYIVGILATTFHLANGLWTFCITWGITQSPASQKAMSYVAALVFIGLSFVGVRSILTFAGVL